ncbi:MAG: hypothetical protein L0Y35_02495, partial [Flammeovirgaceae bacterium]|nr:hypothetical protein [Flammeovirgaceae bacterium]
GWGQRHQINGLYDSDRKPGFGFETLYRKSSVAGSLINATVGYTQLDNGLNIDDEIEKGYYLRLDRTLVSPYSRFAGAVEISRNWSDNVYQKTETGFKDYSYSIIDVWAGYNIGAKKNHGRRSRHFAALRTFHQQFLTKPFQPELSVLSTYNNHHFVLGAVTFYKQDFFKTNYVYGFGRTEDIPYGQTMTLLAGWSKQLGLTRNYLGCEFEKSFVHRGGNFYTLAARVGTFINEKNETQDATLLLTGSFFSHLIPYKKYRIRQSLNTSLALTFNQGISPYLDINGDFGIKGFAADSLVGTKRWVVNTESVIFTPWNFLNFQFAPVVFADLTFLSGRRQHIFYNKPYAGIGAGIRTRNENLVFGTIETRFFYYPRVAPGVEKYKLNFSFNLRVKYTGGFVKAPQFITYN